MKGEKAKHTDVFVLKLLDHHCSGLTDEKLNRALDTFARFALTGTLQKLDPGGRIPIEDCRLSISPENKTATLIISIDAKREKELAPAVATAYKNLLNEVNHWGIDSLITAGRKAYG